MGTRLASSFRPTLLSFASVLVAATTVAADELADVLGLVPDDAVAWAVIPNLSRTNADLSDLIDRADRPELAVAGRPGRPLFVFACMPPVRCVAACAR